MHCWRYTDDIEELLDKPRSTPLIDNEDVETADFIIPIIKVIIDECNLYEWNYKLIIQVWPQIDRILENETLLRPIVPLILEILINLNIVLLFCNFETSVTNIIDSHQLVMLLFLDCPVKTEIAQP